MFITSKTQGVNKSVILETHLTKTFYYKIQIILNMRNMYYENSFVYIF